MPNATPRDPAGESLLQELASDGRGRVLDPIGPISEILFGLFMVLTFTGTMSVATAGREDVRLMLTPPSAATSPGASSTA